MARTYGKAQDLIDFTRASSGTALRRVKYGAELVTNGTFDTDSDWSKGTGWTITGGTAVGAATYSYLSQTILTIGKLYSVTYTVGYTSGIIALDSNTSATATNRTSSGTYTEHFIAVGAVFTLRGTNFTGTIDNVSVKEVTFDTSDGDLILFNHPTNIPRIEYDADGNLLGLLVEEGRTNLNTQSESYIGEWSPVNVTLTENQSSPDGQTSAVKLTLDTLSGNAAITRNVPATSVGTQYVVSAFVKKGENRYATLFGWGNGTDGIAFDIQELTYQINDSWDAGGVIDINDEWVRIWGAVTPLTAPSCYVGMVKSLGSSRAWAGGEYLTVFGVQVEQGSFPTSYIPTSGSTATRSADVASIGVDGFGYNQSAGTVVVEFNPYDVNPSNTYLVFDLSDGTTDERVYSTTNTARHWFVRQGATIQVDIDAGTTASNTSNKLAGSYEVNNFAASLNGGSAIIDTSGNIPTKASVLYLGGTFNGYEMNGHLRSLKYYPRRLTNTQLQELTS